MKVFPKLKALDGHRDGIPVIEGGTYLNDYGDSDLPDYGAKVDKLEWFDSDITLANPGKGLFQ